MKKITKIKLLKNGDKGIEVHGLAVTPAASEVTSQATFVDNVVITRNFPLRWKVRDLVQRLRYPMLVMSLHWRKEFGNMMNDEFDNLDMNQIDPDDKLAAILQSLWEASSVKEVNFEKGNFKIIGESNLQNAKIKMEVIIKTENDYNLYSMVEGILDELAAELMGLLRNPLDQYTTEDARMIIGKMGSVTDEEKDQLGADEIENMLMLTSRHGFPVELNETSLGELAEHANEETDEEQLDEALSKFHTDDESPEIAPQNEPVIEATEPEIIEPEITSHQTQDESSFRSIE